jgi:hypothetical protein
MPNNQPNILAIFLLHCCGIFHPTPIGVDMDVQRFGGFAAVTVVPVQKSKQVAIVDVVKMLYSSIHAGTIQTLAVLVNTIVVDRKHIAVYISGNDNIGGHHAKTV